MELSGTFFQGSMDRIAAKFMPSSVDEWPLVQRALWNLWVQEQYTVKDQIQTVGERQSACRVCLQASWRCLAGNSD